MRIRDVTSIANRIMVLIYDLCLGDHKQPMKTGNASIECKFGMPLEAAIINFVVLGKFQNADFKN